MAKRPQQSKPNSSPREATSTLVDILPRGAELSYQSEDVRIYFVGYQMFASQKGRVGVIVSKSTPYQYPQLGDFIEVPRNVAVDIEGKSRWNGVPTMLMEENGGAEMAKLVSQHYTATAEALGLFSEDMVNPPKFKNDETHEEYQRRVDVWKTQRDRTYDEFYKRLAQADIKTVAAKQAVVELSDDEIIRLARERGLLPNAPVEPFEPIEPEKPKGKGQKEKDEETN